MISDEPIDPRIHTGLGVYVLTDEAVGGGPTVDVPYFSLLLQQAPCSGGDEGVGWEGGIKGVVCE